MKSRLNHLNGEHYGQNRGGLGDQIGIPLVNSRVKVATVISGKLLRKQELIFAPLNHKTVVLKDSEGETVASVMTQAGGVFVLTQPLANGRYTLVVEDESLEGELDITVQSYELKGLQLIAKPREPSKN